MSRRLRCAVRGSDREVSLANIVVLGAGLSGTLMAYELAPHIGPEDTLTLIGEGVTFSFVPSNPWVAVGWRGRDEVEAGLERVMAKRRIRFLPQGAKRLYAGENRIEMNGGMSVSYDYLVIATGPELAFDEIPGLGPGGYTQSICRIDHALAARAAFDELAKSPGPVVVGAAQGASCFGPAYEFAMILDTELRSRRLRDKVPMTFVTSEPYIGHLGLDGVGDTKGMLESLLRKRHIKWITSARISAVEKKRMTVDEVAEDGSVRKAHELPFVYSMILPPFRGVAAVRGIEGLTNAKGFVFVDEHQRNRAYPNVFAIGVCVAIPPVAQYPVPVGVPKTGFMIESMVAATAENIDAMLHGREPRSVATWNTVCLADFGRGGIVFVAQPQIPPRNVNWSSQGWWVHLAKIAYEKYFLRKIRTGKSEPFYERWGLKVLGIRKIVRTRRSKS